MRSLSREIIRNGFDRLILRERFHYVSNFRIEKHRNVLHSYAQLNCDYLYNCLVQTREKEKYVN